MKEKREKRASATGARFSRFIQGKNVVLGVLDRVFVAPDEEEAATGDNIWAWLVFRAARSGTNKEAGCISLDSPARHVINHVLDPRLLR